MIILSLFLSVIALVVLRKRNSASIKLLCSLLIVLSITGIVSANFVCSDKICLDGLIEDWNEIAATPSVTDTIGDSSANDAGEDIYHGYITRDNDYVYFRIDIVGGGVPGSLIIKVEGHPDVTVSCEVGDYSCQAQQVCNQVTNSICLYQDYDCVTGNSGSWYPPDGASGGSNFNFAFAYDFVSSDYGNNMCMHFKPDGPLRACGDPFLLWAGTLDPPMSSVGSPIKRPFVKDKRILSESFSFFLSIWLYMILLSRPLFLSFRLQA